MDDEYLDNLSRPVIITAPTGRCGTNHIRQILSEHPDLYASITSEDFLFHHADRLADYTDELFAHWERQNMVKGMPSSHNSSDKLLAEMAESLLRVIGRREDRTDGRFVIKTSNFGQLDIGLRMFPCSQMIVMIRDPRSSAASYLRAQANWGSNIGLEEYATRWAKSMRYLNGFLTRNQEHVRSGKIIIQRFEPLVEDPVGSYTKLLEKLDLEPDAELLARVASAPVVGSSYLPRNSKGRVSFKRVEKPEGFDPRNRWSDWSPERHAKFYSICGTLMKRWGYEPVIPQNQT